MEKVAKITKLYGSEGQAVITLLSTFPEDFNVEYPIFVRVDGLNVPFYLDSFERRGHKGAVVAFADIDTERRMMEFVGCDLFLPLQNDQEDFDDEILLEDLVGYKIKISGYADAEGLLTGYIDSEMNPLFEAEFNGREVLIPASAEFIMFIDFDGMVITFVLPDGLLEL